jgi:hypothetical protein
MGSRGAKAARLVVYVAVIVLAVPIVIGVGAYAGLFNVSNPFRSETVDRTGPSVLNSLSDLAEYRAASAYYETVVDIEKDTPFVPSFIRGERILYVGKGSVDAVVDFSEMDQRRVEVSEDGMSVSVTLPAPTASDPVLDLEASYVANSDGGLTDGFGGSDLQVEAQRKAIEQMRTAANGGADLFALAEGNTTSMLEGLFGAIGFTNIDVSFDDDPR